MLSIPPILSILYGATTPLPQSGLPPARSISTQQSAILRKNRTKLDKTGHFVLNRSLRIAENPLKIRGIQAIFPEIDDFFLFGDKKLTMENSTLEKEQEQEIYSPPTRLCVSAPLR